jgi:hypothetical protein
MTKDEILAGLHEARRDLDDLTHALRTGNGRVDTLGFILSDLERLDQAIIELEV